MEIYELVSQKYMSPTHSTISKGMRQSDKRNKLHSTNIRLTIQAVALSINISTDGSGFVDEHKCYYCWMLGRTADEQSVEDPTILCRREEMEYNKGSQISYS